MGGGSAEVCGCLLCCCVEPRQAAGTLILNPSCFWQHGTPHADTVSLPARHECFHAYRSREGVLPSDESPPACAVVADDRKPAHVSAWPKLLGWWFCTGATQAQPPRQQRSAAAACTCVPALQEQQDRQDANAWQGQTKRAVCAGGSIRQSESEQATSTARVGRCHLHKPVAAGPGSCWRQSVLLTRDLKASGGSRRGVLAAQLHAFPCGMQQLPAALPAVILATFLVSCLGALPVRGVCLLLYIRVSTSVQVGVLQAPDCWCWWVGRDKCGPWQQAGQATMVPLLCSVWPLSGSVLTPDAEGVAVGWWDGILTVDDRSYGGSVHVTYSGVHHAIGSDQPGLLLGRA